MCSRNDSGGSSSISRANGVGRRRRRRSGRCSLTKNSQGSSPTWPSIGGGAAGGGEAGAPPRPPLPRAPRPRPRPRPLPLPLAAGSATAGAGEGGTRCRAATLAATVEGPGFPLSMADGRGEQKLKEGGDEMNAGRHPPPALYKGTGWGLGRPAQPIKTRKAQGTGTDPPPQPAAARFPASTVHHPKRMRATWQARRRVRRPLPTP